MKPIIALTLALLVAACASPALNRPTEVDNSVSSACIVSRSTHEGHMDFCDSTRLCPATERNQSKALATEARTICSAAPADTQANRDRLWGIVEKQKTLGIAK